MRADAIARVLEMDRRAKQTVEIANAHEQDQKSQNSYALVSVSEPKHQEEDMNTRERTVNQIERDHSNKNQSDRSTGNTVHQNRGFGFNPLRFSRSSKQNRASVLADTPHIRQNSQSPSADECNNDKKSRNEPEQGLFLPFNLSSGTFEGILDKLGLDTEVILLLFLVLLLANEGADISLLLALGYIIL